jgi:hypothetical protein
MYLFAEECFQTLRFISSALDLVEKYFVSDLFLEGQRRHLITSMSSMTYRGVGNSAA